MIATKKTVAKKKITVVQFLRRVYTRVKKGWCQNHDALDKDGVSIEEIRDFPKASKVCLNGAIIAVEHAVDPKRNTGVREKVENLFDTCLRGDDICDFNDAKGRKKSSVLKLIEEAIKLAKAQAKTKK